MERQDVQIDTQEMTLANIEISRIRPFADQPRTDFDEEDLLGLANSIEEIGLQQPISVKPIYNDSEHDFELVDGERRLRACRMIHLIAIRAFISPEMDKDDQFIASVAANFCRANHTSMETAVAVHKMVTGFMSHKHLSREEGIEKAAKICGRSSAWATQHLSLLRLCPDVQGFLTNKKISFQIGIALTGIKEEFQLRFARHIISAELDQRQSLAYIRNQRTPDIVNGYGRNRRPSDDYVIIVRSIKKLDSDLETLLDISMKKIRETFKSRPTEDFNRLIADVENVSQQARLLAENLKAASK